MTVLIELAKKLNLLSLLGVVGPIAVGIWFLGPLLVFGDFAPLRPLTNRLMAIGLLLVGWGVYCLVAWLMSRRREGSFSKALAKEGDDGPRPDTAELRREFQRTLKALRRAKVRIYQLPWYAIIGTSGTGKTTALINSGLNFPLAKSHGKRAVRGVGSTKQCDWWFTDEAVLLDTAGRYATQEQARVDEGEWLALLDLLRRHRRRRPLNGVFVAISAADLIQMDEEGRAEWAGLLRRRLTEMNERLGVWLPIYLLVTKCDLLVGFVEFFADLDRAGREQIWGFTLPLAVSDDPGDGTTSPVAERVGSEFDLLEERLIQWQTQRLQDERDMRRRDLIHSFPQQFAALKGALEDFVEVVFTANRFEATARLRGVYFTSATQQGTPIDRLLGRLTSRLGLAAQALASAGGRGRSYFLTEALRLAIGESELVGQRSRGERRARWVTTAGLAALLTIGAGLGIWFYASYRANWLGVAEASTAIDTLEDRNRVLLPEDRAPVAALPILDGVRQLPWGAQEGSPPGTRGAGFDQGDKLAPVTAYHRLLGEALLPRLVVQLEEALHRSAGQDLYATLVAYLRLGTPERFEATGIRNWFADAWANDIRLDDGERRRLTEHLEVLLAHHQQMPVPTLSEPLVAEARARLSRVPTAQRLYARLQVTAQGLAPFRLGQAAGLDADRVLVRPSGRSLDTALSGLYTRVGYYRFLSRQLPQVLQDAAGDTWVLGTSYYDGQDSALQLQGEICQLYLSDYAQQWQDLLDDLALAPLIEPVQAAIALERMAAPDSPMRLGLVAIARESLLSRPPSPTPVSEEAGEDAPDPVVPACPSTLVEQYVDQRFAAFQRAVLPGDSPPPLDAIRDLLAQLGATLESTAAPGEDGQTPAQRRQGLLRQLESLAARQPAPLDRWLINVSGGVEGLQTSGLRSHLNEVWRTEILPFCQRRINGRYPLQVDSPQDIDLVDFARFFGPGGLLDRAFAQHLATFVDTRQQPWRWRQLGGDVEPLPYAAIAPFERAATIRRAFFDPRGQGPSMAFVLQPLRMDSTIERFELDLDGQRVDYRHGPNRSAQLVWPGPANTNRVEARFFPPVGGSGVLSAVGPWAWFRFLEANRLRPGSQSGYYRLTLENGERQVGFSLRLEGAADPLQLDALRVFRCPLQL